MPIERTDYLPAPTPHDQLKQLRLNLALESEKNQPLVDMEILGAQVRKEARKAMVNGHLMVHPDDYPAHSE